MTFSRLLPLLLLVPALTMADDDRNFKIMSENFKVGSVLEHASNIAIVLDSSVAISSQPVFPLQPNQLYLRQKKSVKEYLWFSGVAKTEEYLKLHAFNLKENHIGVREAVGMRFYASRQQKAFQDEADIYFDSENIYSSRVAKLLFMKNGKWQTLNESAHPGIVEIQSNEKDLEIVSYNTSLQSNSKIFYPVKEGFYTFAFSVPGKFPYVDAGQLHAGKSLVFKVNCPVFDSSASSSVNLSVSLPVVQERKTLEETEVLYDAFSAEVDQNVGKVDTTEFANIYPVLKPADSLGLTDSSKEYRGYVNRYKYKRNEAQKIWRTTKLGEVNQVFKAIRDKIDSLQQFPLQLNVWPRSVEAIEKGSAIKMVELAVAVVDSSAKVADSTAKAADSAVVADSSAKVADSAVVANSTAVPADSAAKVADSTAKASDSTVAPVAAVPASVEAKPAKPDTLKLAFGSNQERVDVVWKGVVKGYSMDSLYAKLKSVNPSVIVTLFLTNNKPVWISKEGSLVGRYHYRYEKIAFRIGEKLYEGEGKFILPTYIEQEPEVRDWIHRVEIPTSNPTVATDTTHKFAVPIIEHATRGTVAIVDSGSFRYRGKVVSMSPFAIHTTEVTQEFYKITMDKLDSAKRIPDRSTFKGPNKPVQGISWEKAQYFCKALGGDLPTEAQWEFAGRAGGNSGALWEEDDHFSVNKYAVFAENSYKLGKKDSVAYGPHDVATKEPNAWGMYDMSGNVAEWTRDNYFAITFKIEDSNPTGSYWGTNKVLKGGSWKDGVKKLYMTDRDDEDPRYWADHIGFRCVFSLERINQGQKK